MDSQPKRRGRPPGSKNKAKVDQEMVSNVMLKPTELCDIIKACRDNGVLSLEFRDLKLNFPEKNNVEQEIVKPVEQHYPELTPEQIEAEKKERQEEMQIYDLELLMLENPAEYERVMVGKETLNADTGT